MESDLEPVPVTPYKQDIAWKHCQVFKYGERVQIRCIYCEKMFKGGGITRVKEHLGGVKGQGPICTKVPPEVRAVIKQSLDSVVRRQRKKRKSMPEPLSSLPSCELDSQLDEFEANNGVKSAPNPLAYDSSMALSRTKQKTYRRRIRKNAEDRSPYSKDEFVAKGLIEAGARDMDNLYPVEVGVAKNAIEPGSFDMHDSVHMAVGRFLFDIGANFDATKSVYFQPMIDAILSRGLGFPLPTNNDLRGWILKKAVEEMKSDTNQCKALWRRTGCSVLVEQWNSDKGRTVLNFLAYSPEKTVFLKSVEVSQILFSSEHLYEVFKQVIEEVGAVYVVQVITRCEDHYIAAGKRLMDEYPNLYWAPCAAHCIDMMLKDFGQLEWMSEVIDQARSITTFIYNHTGVLNMMRRFTSGNDIVQPGTTRSATNFATLGRMAEFRYNLQAMVTSQEWNDLPITKNPGGLAVSSTISDQAFWNSCTVITRLTNPLLRLLRIVRSEKRPAMGYVYAGLYWAKEAIKKEIVKEEDYTAYWKIIDYRWEQQLNVPLHAAGFFLNPKFFYNIEDEMRSEVLSAMFDCIERLVPDINVQDKISKEINLYKNADGVFGRNLAIRARDNMLPAEWWSTYGEACLNLSRFAIRILSQTCSVIGCKNKQIFIEQMHEAKNCIEQQRLSDLVFVQYNMQLRHMADETRDDYFDPMSITNNDLLEDWIAKNEAIGEDDGCSDWMSLEPPNNTLFRSAGDDADILDTGFDDLEIFKRSKEVKEENYYSTVSEKLFM